MMQTTNIEPVLKRLAEGGRIEAKGAAGERPGVITFRRVQVGRVEANMIKLMLNDGLLYCEPGHTQTHYGITQKGRAALAALARSH
jgi:hypothetical protein